MGKRTNNYLQNIMEKTEDISVHLWHRYFITVNHAYHARLKERPTLSCCCCNGVKWSVIWVGSALMRSRVKILEYFVWRVDASLTKPPKKFPILLYLEYFLFNGLLRCSKLSLDCTVISAWSQGLVPDHQFCPTDFFSFLLSMCHPL
jgi:hypothetical protein